MAGERTLKVTILGDSKSAELAFSRLDASTSTIGSKMSALGDHVQDVGRRMAGIGKDLTTKVTLPIVAGLGLATKAAAEDAKAQALLATSLRNNTHATDGQIASVEKWITRTQNATGVIDDKLRPALSKLLIAGRTVEQSQRDLSVALDIAAARGLDLDTVVTAMGKAAQGNVGGLQRLGIATKDAAGHTLTFDQILQNASKTMGGAAATAAQTTAGRVEILKAKMADLTENIGNALLPILTEVAGWVSTLADRFNGLSPRMQQVVTIALVAAAAIGPLVSIVGGLVVVVGALLSPVGLVVVALAALTAGVIYAYTHWAAFREAVDAAGKAIVAVVGWLQDQVGNFVAWWESVWPQVSEAVGHVVHAIDDVVRVVLGGVEAFWRTFGDNILGVAKAVWSQIQNVVDTYIRIVRDIIQTVIALINGDWGKAWDSIKDIPRAAFDFIVGLVKNGIEIVRQYLSGAGKIIGGAAAGMWDGIKDAFRAVLNWIASAWNRLRFKMPSFDTHIPGVGTIGGFEVGVPAIGPFHKGGVIPGAPGSDVLVWAQAGERVVPRSGPPERLVTVNATFNTTVNGRPDQATWDELDRRDKRLLNDISRALATG